MSAPSSGAIVIPQAPTRAEDGAHADLDRAVADVRARKDDWARLPIAERLILVEQAMRDTHAVADEWGRLAREAKGIAAGTPAEGEDLATGPLQLVRHLRILRDVLRDLDQRGEVQLPDDPYVRDDGRVVVPVFPTGTWDKLLYPGYRAEVWTQPHVTLDTLRIGTAYGQRPAGRVCFVLGAGNVSSIGAMDAIHQLFAEHQVCVIKMNPVNEHLGPVIEQALRPFIREGYLRVVYGGAAAGQYLVDHPDVDTIHMTGSDKTYGAIVFGAADEGERRRAAGERAVDKPFTAELGNVTPVIVVPGPWSDHDLAYQGKHIVSMVVNNGGFNCACPRVVVQHASWSRRRDLVEAMRASLREAPQRAAYYPGARDRWQLFIDAHPDAETYGSTAPGEVPWTFLPGLDPTASDDVAFRVEAFNGTFGEVALDAPRDVGAYLDRAVDWVNETLWGSLTATILVHPKQLEDPDVAAAVDRARARLRYGSVGVNVWSAVSYGLISTTWGAYPGHPPTDIQSGAGVVHNTYLVEDVEKTVLEAPWRLGKKPPMAYDFTTMPSLVRRLIAIEATGDWRQLPGVVIDGMRA